MYIGMLYVRIYVVFDLPPPRPHLSLQPPEGCLIGLRTRAIVYLRTLQKYVCTPRCKFVPKKNTVLRAQPNSKLRARHQLPIPAPRLSASARPQPLPSLSLILMLDVSPLFRVLLFSRASRPPPPPPPRSPYHGRGVRACVTDSTPVLHDFSASNVTVLDRARQQRRQRLRGGRQRRRESSRLA